MRYIVWPDGTYCEEEDLEEYMAFSGLSDDFEVVEEEPDQDNF